MNPIEEQKTLFSRARETMKTEEAQKSNQKSETGVLVSLGLSSLFTIIYLVVALGESLIDIGWSQITAYCIGGLLGLAAIMPGEASVWIWKTKLQSDYEINGTQIAVAWIGGLLAAVSAAVSTVSFFAYMLQGLMPGWYDPNTAAGINIVNIAAGWAVFGIAIFVYYATSDTSTRNKNRAKAVHVARMAIDEMIAGIAQGTKDKIEEVVSSMGKNNVFIDDALDNIGQAMGLSPERQQLLQDHARQTIGESPTAPRETAVAHPSERYRVLGGGAAVVVDGLVEAKERAQRTANLFGKPAEVFDIANADKLIFTANPNVEAPQPTRPTPAPQANGRAGHNEAGLNYPYSPE